MSEQLGRVSDEDGDCSWLLSVGKLSDDADSNGSIVNALDGVNGVANSDASHITVHISTKVYTSIMDDIILFTMLLLLSIIVKPRWQYVMTC